MYRRELARNFFFALAMLLMQGTAVAHDYYPERWETVFIPDSWVRLDPGRRIRLQIPGGWRYVQKLYIQARASSFSYQDGTFEVRTVSGTKGTVYVPRNDPSYVVTVAETTSSIELKHTRGGSIDILSIKAVLAERCPEPPSGPPVVIVNPPPVVTNPPSVTNPPPVTHPQPNVGANDNFNVPTLNVATWLASAAGNVVDELRDDVDPQTEYIPYLLPIKTLAGTAYSVGQAYGDLAPRTRDAMVALEQQINFAKPVTDNLLRRDATFQRAVRLLWIAREIEERLQIDSTKIQP